MKLSIIMLTYNHEKFIAEAIEGVLMQETNFDFELLVANDHSTDRTEDVVAEYRERHPGIIKGFNNKKNLGPRFNFIKAYETTNGDYIAMCEGDDFWTDPAKLQKQVDFLEAHEDYVLCFHDIDLVDEGGALFRKAAVSTEDKRDYSINEMLGVYVPTPTIVYRKTIRKLPSYFKQTDNGDTMVLAMLTGFGKAKFLPEILHSSVRKHPGGIWSTKSHLARWSSILRLRYLILKNTGRSLRPELYKKYILVFDKAAADALAHNSPKYWYRYNLQYVQFCLAAKMYGKARLVSKRVIKRYLGFKQWLPKYEL